MPKLSTASNHAAIDPAMMATIVATVIARLKEMKSTNTTPTIQSKVIDAKTIQSFQLGTTVAISAGAVITPAAKDEAKLRNITLQRATKTSSPSKKIETTVSAILDASNARAEAVTAQLKRRGVASITANIVLSDTPAREVANQFGKARRAVMVGSISDVSRFGEELNPEVWVLDMKRMNLITAVNVVAAITRIGKTNV